MNAGIERALNYEKFGARITEMELWIKRYRL
jgi:hypothetical protein